MSIGNRNTGNPYPAEIDVSVRRTLMHVNQRLGAHERASQKGVKVSFLGSRNQSRLDVMLLGLCLGNLVSSRSVRYFQGPKPSRCIHRELHGDTVGNSVFHLSDNL